MSKSQTLESRINYLKSFPASWVYTKGHKFFIQEIATGSILKEFSNYEQAEMYVQELEEKEIRERIEKGFDIHFAKGKKEYFFFKDENADDWTCDISINGELKETNFISADDVFDEIKYIKKYN